MRVTPLLSPVTFILGVRGGVFSIIGHTECMSSLAHMGEHSPAHNIILFYDSLLSLAPWAVIIDFMCCAVEVIFYEPR